MDQRIYIKFCVKNKMKCSNVFKMLTAAFGESTLSKKMFISGASSSQKAEMLKMPALDAPACQQPMKTLKK